MKKLVVLLIGHNEELNLPSCLGGISRLNLDVDLLYVDQKSEDDSVALATEAGASIYTRDIRYIEPDRKRVVETLLDEDDWCLMLDCDEVITESLAKEIEVIVSGPDDVYKVKRKNYFLGIVRSTTYEWRLFKPKNVHMTDVIHYGTKARDGVVVRKTKSYLINDDKKLHGNEINLISTKWLRYTDIDAEQKSHLSFFKARCGVLFMPLIWFLAFLLVHGNILKGVRGFINAVMLAWYQFLVYAKVLEKKYQSSPSGKGIQ